MWWGWLPFVNVLVYLCSHYLEIVHQNLLTGIYSLFFLIFACLLNSSPMCSFYSIFETLVQLPLCYISYTHISNSVVWFCWHILASVALSLDSYRILWCILLMGAFFVSIFLFLTGMKLWSRNACMFCHFHSLFPFVWLILRFPEPLSSLLIIIINFNSSPPPHHSPSNHSSRSHALHFNIFFRISLCIDVHNLWCCVHLHITLLSCIFIFYQVHNPHFASPCLWLDSRPNYSSELFVIIPPQAACSIKIWLQFSNNYKSKPWACVWVYREVLVFYWIIQGNAWVVYLLFSTVVTQVHKCVKIIPFASSD